VAPSNSNVIWAGTDAGNVWISTDYGTNWNEVTGNLPQRWVTRVVADYNDENIAYVTFSGLKWTDPQPHIFRTADQGQTWSDISSNLPDAPINAFAVDPYRPNVLFIGTDLGAYYSIDTGQSWQYLSSNLPMVSVYDMKIHETEYYLALGTHARSMYKLDLSSITGIDISERENLERSFQLMQNYPNPFNPVTTIPYKLAKPARIKIAIYNTLGQEIRTLVNEEQAAGDYQITWNGTDNQGLSVASGIYIYRLTTDNFSEEKRLTFVK